MGGGVSPADKVKNLFWKDVLALKRAGWFNQTFFDGLICPSAEAFVLKVFAASTPWFSWMSPFPLRQTVVPRRP